MCQKIINKEDFDDIDLAVNLNPKMFVRRLIKKISNIMKVVSSMARLQH